MDDRWELSKPQKWHELILQYFNQVLQQEFFLSKMLPVPILKSEAKRELLIPSWNTSTSCLYCPFDSRFVEPKTLV